MAVPLVRSRPRLRATPVLRERRAQDTETKRICAPCGCRDITFHTKPFYGGKLHRVTSEVKNGSQEIICRVQGEWNGALEFTYANGETKVIDTSDLETVRKRVRPMHMQGEYESRKLWHKVTESLKSGEIDSATRHKRFLEERQRQGERHRKETNTSFPTKYFVKQEDSWLYKDLLQREDNLLINL